MLLIVALSSIIIIELSDDPIVEYPLRPLPIPKTLPDSAPNKVVLLLIKFLSPIVAVPPI